MLGSRGLGAHPAILALGVAAGLAAPAAAKERLVRHLGVDDALVPESVHAIAQDEAGFLWFGTGGGLVRYDGERLVPWAPAAIRGKIEQIAIHRGALIAAAWDGPVFRTQAASAGAAAAAEVVALRGPDGAPLIGVRDVAFDRAGRLWVAPRHGPLLRSEDLGATWSAPLADALAGARVRAVREAGAPLTPRVASTVLHLLRDRGIARRADAQLSPREQQVLAGFVDGKSYKQVAADLGVQLDTVRTYVRTLYRKLQVNSVSAAVTAALRRGLV